jgi:hypothetical protein
VGEPRKPESAPLWSVIRYAFPSRGYKKPPVTLTWYDGKKDGALNQPPAEVAGGIKPAKNGTLFVGEKGTLYCRLGGSPQLHPQEAFKDFKAPPTSLPRVMNDNHYIDFIRACKGERPAGSAFGYAAPLTEIVLLGNVALRLGKPIEWDGRKLQAKKCPEAEPLIRRPYRKGWTLG